MLWDTFHVRRWGNKREMIYKADMYVFVVNGGKGGKGVWEGIIKLGLFFSSTFWTFDCTMFDHPLPPRMFSCMHDNSKLKS